MTGAAFPKFQSFLDRSDRIIVRQIGDGSGDPDSSVTVSVRLDNGAGLNLIRKPSLYPDNIRADGIKIHIRP